MKRLFFVLCAVSLITVVYCSGSNDKENVYITVSGKNGLSVTGYTGNKPVLKIPPVIGGLPVIPNNVRQLAYDAFDDNVVITRQ